MSWRIPMDGGPWFQSMPESPLVPASWHGSCGPASGPPMRCASSC